MIHWRIKSDGVPANMHNFQFQRMKRILICCIFTQMFFQSQKSAKDLIITHREIENISCLS